MAVSDPQEQSTESQQAGTNQPDEQEQSSRQNDPGMAGLIASLQYDSEPWTLDPSGSDENSERRFGTLNALADMGPAARAAVPAIIKVAETAQGAYANAAMNALRRIAPRDGEVVPGLIAQLNEQGKRKSAVAILEVIGTPEAKAAVKAADEKLKRKAEASARLQQEQQENMRRQVQALIKPSPAAATKRKKIFAIEPNKAFRRLWQTVYEHNDTLQGYSASAWRRMRYKNGVEYVKHKDAAGFSIDVFILPTKREGVYLVRIFSEDKWKNFSTDQLLERQDLGYWAMIDLETGLLQSWSRSQPLPTSNGS